MEHGMRTVFSASRGSDFELAAATKSSDLESEAPISIYSVDKLIHWVLDPVQVTVKCQKNVPALFWNFIIVIKSTFLCKMQHVIRDGTLTDANLEENLSVGQMPKTKI